MIREILLNLKIFFDTNTKYYLSIFALQLAFFFSALFELIGVLMLGPLIFVTTNYTEAYQNSYVQIFNQLLNIDSQYELVASVFLLTILLIILGGVFSVISILLLSKMATSSGVVLGNRLLEGYMKLTWKDITEITESKAINEIYQESSRVTQNVLVPMLMINKNLILFSFIILGLLLVDPFMTLYFFLFLCGSYIAIYFFFRARLYNNSEKLTAVHELRLSYLSDIFKLFKQIKVWNTQNYFLKGFDDASQNWGRVYKQNLNISLLPRYFVEILILLGCCVGIISIFFSNGDISDTIPKISIFAFSAFKLLPAVQGMYYSTSQIRGNIFSLSSILETLNSFSKTPLDFSAKIDVVKSIEFRDVNFNYGGANAFSLKGINFSISNNKLIGISGHSGSGKSTFLNILLGLIEASNGKIFVNNELTQIHENKEWFSKISYAPPKTYFINDTLRTNIYLNKDSDISSDQLMKFSNIDFIQNAGLDEIHRDDSFSEGQMQRLGLGRAFAKGSSDIFVFDEPTSSLDTLNRNYILNSLYNLSKSKIVIVVTHDLELLHHCDEIFIFNDGELEIYSSFKEAASKSYQLKNLIDANEKSK